MKIKAMQKLTLLDFPGKTAATIFTCGCNLRCPFCHNASLVVGEKESDGFTFDEEAGVTEEEVLNLLESRRGRLDGIAITGGEPLLQKDIAEFIKKVKEKGFLVKLDTNGFMPEKLKELLEEKLVDYVAMDVKQSPEKYYIATGIPDIKVDNFSKSIEIIKNSGVDYEFRTTVCKGIHEKEDIESICKWIGSDAHYFLQMYKDSGDILANRDGKSNLDSFSADEAEELLDVARKIIPTTTLRGL